MGKRVWQAIGYTLLFLFVSVFFIAPTLSFFVIFRSADVITYALLLVLIGINIYTVLELKSK